MKNVDGRSTNRHDNKKFRTRSVEKQEWRLVSGRRRQVLKEPDRYIDVTASPKSRDRLWSQLGLLFGSFPGVKRPGREG